jgi:hypothetical protein
MPYILSLLPLLACPVGMGLIMWFMMRGSKQGQTPQETDFTSVNRSQEPDAITEAPPQREPLFKMLFMCLNWKVVIGLAIVALIVLVLAPQFILGALPLLIVAACPLSMLFMMRGMRGMQNGMSRPTSPLTSMRQSPALDEPTREAQLAALRSQLSHIQTQQEAIASRITQIESDDGGASFSPEYASYGDSNSFVDGERREALPKG